LKTVIFLQSLKGIAILIAKLKSNQQEAWIKRFNFKKEKYQCLLEITREMEHQYALRSY